MMQRVLLLITVALMSFFTEVLTAADNADAEFYLRLGKAFYAQGRPKRALGMYERAEQLEPLIQMGASVARAHAAYAGQLLEREDASGAIACFEKALGIDPEIAVTQELGAAYFLRGRRELEDGRISESIESLKKAGEYMPGNSAIREKLAEALIAKREFSTALGILEEFLKESPGDMKLRLRIGLLHEKAGNDARAIQLYRGVIRDDPENAGAYCALGEYHERKGQPEIAERIYKEGLEKAGDDPLLHANIAWLYIERGQYLKAYESCKEALEQDRDNPYLHNYLGIIYIKIDRVTEAIEACKKALSLSPDYPGAHFNLAVAYGMAGRTEDAVKEYRWVIRKEPDNAEAHYNLGLCYTKQRRYEEARYHFERAAKLYGAQNDFNLKLPGTGGEEE